MTDVEHRITLTALAAEKFREHVAAEPTQPALRLGVRGGGCSGYQYVLALDHVKPDDHVFEDRGVTIIVDPESFPLVKGSRIDYEDSLMESGFRVDNPNAVSGCGCGSSFRVANEPPSCGAAL